METAASGTTNTTNHFKKKLQISHRTTLEQRHNISGSSPVTVTNTKLNINKETNVRKKSNNGLQTCCDQLVIKSKSLKSMQKISAKQTQTVQNATTAASLKGELEPFELGGHIVESGVDGDINKLKTITLNAETNNSTITEMSVTKELLNVSRCVTTNNNTNSDKKSLENNYAINISDCAQESKDSKTCDKISTNNRYNTDSVSSQRNEIYTNAPIKPTTTTSNNWNNSKYLHKKFKRLASTNETEEVAAHEQQKSFAICSAASSLPIPVTATSSSNSTGDIRAEIKDTQQEIRKKHQNYLINSANNKVNNISANISKNNVCCSSSENLVVKLLGTSYNASDHNALQSSQTALDANSYKKMAQEQCNLVVETNQSTVGNSSTVASGIGRYVCPYCSLNCNKPSVLQKHIRAHTNERPYPCDLCDIAFKTKSNYYKHCRSRSHCARQQGIEVPVDAEENYSDQEVEAELSNGSSDISRAESPLNENNASSPTAGISLQQSPHQAFRASPSSSLPYTSTYVANQQVSLGSPAAGTLPPTTASITNSSQSNITTTCTSSYRQAIDFKPYKPKFHKAALYVLPKEGVPTKEQHFTQHQEQQYLPKPQQRHYQSQLDRQQLSVDIGVGLPMTSAPQSIPAYCVPMYTPPHHASLSPSLQSNLNNSINASQLQLQLQHHMLPSTAVSDSLYIPSVSTGICYDGLSTSSSAVEATALLNPTAHFQQPLYNHIAAGAAQQQSLAAFQLISPQKLHLQLLPHHEQMQSQLQNSTVANVSLACSPGLKTNITQSSQRNNNNRNQHTNFIATSQLSQPVYIDPISENSMKNQTKTSFGMKINKNENNNPVNTVSVTAANGVVQLNKEFLQERISKIISQNEAIVENKEHLLQKKYPKLNRSRSLQLTVNNNNINECNNISSAVATSKFFGVTEKDNLKINPAIVNKKQKQPHQHIQQQHYQTLPSAQQQNKLYGPMTQQLQSVFLEDTYNQMKVIPQALTVKTQNSSINGVLKHFTAVNKSEALASTVQCFQSNTKYAQIPQNTHMTRPGVHMPMQHMPGAKTHDQQEQHNLPQEKIACETITSSSNILPLNLSSKSKNIDEDVHSATSNPISTLNMQTANLSTSNKRSMEQMTNVSEGAYFACSAGTSLKTHGPPINSIIKNLLLNARGLAVPTGEGDDAVYKCPLCTMEFRTAEDLQLHNSTYCQGASSSAPLSPISSPSYKYLRSNSLSLNLPDLKSSLFLKNNPLSLAKLAWSQLKTKPSSLVLSQLSAVQSSSTSEKAVTTTTTSSGVIVANTTSQAANRVLTEGPLPSPGPLLGKTPLVGGYNNKKNDLDMKSAEVVITKLHEENQFNTKERMNTKDEGCNEEPFQLTAASIEILPTTINRSQNISSGEDIEDKREAPKRFTSSGGYMIPISECSEFDQSTKMIRTPLLSGGSFQEVSPKSKEKIENNQNATVATSLNVGIGGLRAPPQHFQFPPITSKTAFNSLPLKLAPLQIIPSTISAEKIIPYVPGIPGPATLSPQLLPPPQNLRPSKCNVECLIPRNSSPTGKRANSPFIALTEARMPDLASKPLSLSGSSDVSRTSLSEGSKNIRKFSSNKSLEAVSKKSFNFLHMFDNSTARQDNTSTSGHPKGVGTQKEVRHFNFDVLCKEPDLIVQPNTTSALTCMKLLHINTNPSSTSGSDSAPVTESRRKNQFLRPTSLPLKPGTFVPKKHHGITPTANTLPLISPETPRPSKACVQLYLNGHAYTYLGLKCSTKMYYCTVNLPQPSYVAEMHKLSMYSVWQVCAENNPHPLGFKPKTVIALYDSRQKTVADTLAGTRKLTYNVTASQPVIMTPFVNITGQYYHHQLKHIPGTMSLSSSECADNMKFENDHTDNATNSNGKKEHLLVGGYESHEDYTYIRGRGRGRYVCSECGIRCKKPSMLKKHIRTHTDVRPYTCNHCNFSFKTKGNLTKHMQSKSHYKKCVELGLNPGPMPPDSEFGDAELELDQQSTTSAGGGTSSVLGESDSDDFSDNGSESSDAEEFKSRLQEHEAAHCLLSLSMTPPIRQSVSPQQKHQQEMKNSSLPSKSFEPSSSTPQEVMSFKGGSSLSTSQLAGVKRVVSFTSPKPPFDYQKQEQYYSNPEASKPKRSAYCASTIDSTPMDLTKPRPPEISTSSSKVFTPSIPTTLKTTGLELSSIPGRIQTQAQIQEFIFGKSNNESGFLKTLYSVSDKVRVTADQAEYTKKINENGLLQTYLTEQALHYTKIKQSQMSPSFQDAPSKLDNDLRSTFNEKLLTAWSDNTKTKTTMMGAKLFDEKPIVKINSDVAKISSIEVTEEKEKECHKPASWKSSDEGEDSESSPSDHELMLTNKTNAIIFTSLHNANLPSAVQQPGTTDFSGVLTSAAAPTRTVIVGEDGFRKSNNNDIQSVYARVPLASDGRSVCTICSKSFQKQHQLVLHMNIHYMERKFKCESCAVSFRTQGHLQKHERSEAHKNKVMMTSTFGVATSSNPRPFECIDCKIAFRIHGHLAKHLRSKTHVQKLECLQKLPFGTYAEIERAGVSLTEIDTTDCDNALISLKLLAQKLMENDSSKLNTNTGLMQKNGTSDSQCALGSQDSASEDGFSAAASAAANAIASLENDSAATTPQRGNSTSEDEGGLTNCLKRRLPSSLNNGEENSHTQFNVNENEKRIKTSDSKASASPTSQSN